MKKLAVLQSNYIPWKGYFDLIAAVDEFVLYDDMQFTKNDWRNRNYIKTPAGRTWLTVPVGQNINRKIREVSIPQTNWRNKHLKSFEMNYKKAKYYHEIMELISPLYEEIFPTLTELNAALIRTICGYLGITTKITGSWEYTLPQDRNERLVHLCDKTSSQEYVSGPAAKQYIDEGLFERHEIRLTWFNYEGYPEYPQLWGSFIHEVTILDLLFNCGKESSRYMKLSSKRVKD